MAKNAEELDPVVVPIENEKPGMTLDEWLATLAKDEPVNLGTSAAQLLAEAREDGEV